MKIADLINELFESKEMSEYLIQNIDKLTKYNILNMICKAPIDIRRKAEILFEFSKDEDIEAEITKEIKGKDDVDYEWIKKFIEEQFISF